MNATIDVPNEVYERLQKQARLRGTTISEAISQLLEEVETTHREAVFEQMRAEGVLLPKKSLPPDHQRLYKRIEVQGKPVSECLIEARR